MSETATRSDLERFADEWIDAGLKKASIAPLVATLQRSDAIAYEAQLAETATRGVSKDVGGQIASGDLSYEEGLAEATRRLAFVRQASLTQRAALGPILRDDARAACHKAARAFLQESAARLADEAEGSVGAASIRTFLETYAGLERIAATA